MPDATTIDPDGPPLRTFVWLRRVALASAIAGVALLALRAAAMHVAERRWQATRPALRDAGVPDSVGAMQPTPIPDAENAGVLYRQAATAYVSAEPYAPRNSNADESTLGPPWARTARWRSMVEASASANAPALSTTRLARTTTDPDRADWGITYRRPAFAILLPHLNNSRAIANLCVDVAERDLIAGDAAAGVERLRDVLHLARSLAVRPCVVEMLVAEGIASLASETIVSQAERLRIGPGPGGATLAQARALIDELLAVDARIRDGAGYATEGVMLLDTVESAAEAGWLTRPVWRLDRPRVARVATDAVTVARSDFAGREAIAPVRPWPNNWTTPATMRLPGVPADYRIGRPAVPMLVAEKYRRTLVTDSQAAMHVRVAAIAVAVRWYASEHDGRWPASLEALVPRYLSKVPTNPLAADGSPFGYRLIPNGRPGGGDRVLVIVDATKRIDAERPMGLDGSGAAVDLAPWAADSGAE